MYCGLFLATTKVADVHSLSIRIQDFSQYTSTNDLVLQLSGLVANVDYDIYCMTTTFDDKFEMALAHIVETRTPISMPCCREDFAVDLLSKYQPTSSNSVPAVTISAGLFSQIFHPVRVSFDVIPLSFDGTTASSPSRRKLTETLPPSNVTWMDCIRNVSVYPHSLIVPADPQSGYEKNVLIGSICPGNFLLNISAVEIDFDGKVSALPLAFPNGADLQILSPSSSNFPSPQLRSALFVLSGEVIELRFDSYTNMGNLGGITFKCKKLIEFLNSENAICLWKSASRLQIVSGLSHLYLQDNITLLENVITSKFSSSSVAETSTVSIGMALSAFPRAAISAPTQIKPCSSFVLDLTGSSGAGGHGWDVVSIQVRSMFVNSTNLTHTEYPIEINSFYSSIYDITSPSAIPLGYMLPNTRYFFDVKLCSRFGHCAYSSHKTEVLSQTFPDVYILGSQYKTLVRSHYLRISAQPIVASCDGASLSSSEFKALYTPSYSWKIYDVNGSFLLLERVFTNKYKSSLVLSPYSLKSEKHYKVVAMLSVLDQFGKVVTSTSQCIVSVSKAPLKAALSPSSNAVLPFGQSLLINASESFDMDVSSSVSNSELHRHLMFNWTCTQLDGITVGENCNRVLSSGGVNSNIVHVISNSSSVGALYRIDMLLTSSLDDRHSLASVEVVVEPDCCTTLSIPTLGIANTQEKLVLSGTVITSLTGLSSWSILESSLDLDVVASTPLTQIITVFRPTAMSTDVMLVIPPDSLFAGNTYTFMLEFYSDDGFDYRAAKTTVTMNDIPKPGRFTISPSIGVELIDEFSFSTSYWTDEHFPLHYYFGCNMSNGHELIIKNLNFETSQTSMLLRGFSLDESAILLHPSMPCYNISWCLPCFVTGYDELGAYATKKQVVEVTPGTFNSSDLSKLYSIFQNETHSPDEIIPAAELSDDIHVVNCSISPDCLSLSRQDCSNIDHTCGPCLHGTDGDDGDANTLCVNRTASEEGAVQCLDDADCPASWICNINLCEALFKTCSATCMQNGECLYFNKTVANYTNECYLSDASCSAVCECDSGYYGNECNIDDTELIGIVEWAEEVSCGYVDLISESFDGSYDVIDWLSFFRSNYLKPYQLSTTFVTCMLTTLHYITNLRLSDTMLTLNNLQAIWNGVDTALNFESLYQHHNQTSAQQQDILLDVSKMLLSFCELIASDDYFSTFGQISHTANSARVSMLAFAFDGEDVSADLFVGNKNLSLGDENSPGKYCLVRYESIYNDRMEIMLGMETFHALSSKNVHMVGKTSFDGGYFVIDINPRNFKFNITCHANILSTTAIQCPDGQKYNFSCLGENSNWNFLCPENGSAATCSPRKPAASSEKLDSMRLVTSCSVESLLNVSVHCNCQTNPPTISTVRKYVEIEFHSLLLCALQEFFSTVSAVHLITADNIKNGWNVVISFVIVLLGICGAVVYAKHVDETGLGSKIQNDKKGVMRISRADALKSDFTSKYMNLEDQLPRVYADYACYDIFLDEIKKSHRWISLLYNFDVDYPRSIRLLLLCSIANCVLFFNILLNDATNPVDTFCNEIHSKYDCLDRKSIFAASESMCYWDMGADALNNSTNSSILLQECYLRKPANNGIAVCSIAAVAALLSVPFILIMEVVVGNILRYPTRQYHSHKINDEELISPEHGGFDIEENHSGNLCMNKFSICEFEKISDIELKFAARDELIQLICDLHAYKKQNFQNEIISEFDARWGYTTADLVEFLDHMKYFYGQKISSDDRNIHGIGEDIIVGKSIKQQNSELVPTWSSLLLSQCHPFFYSIKFRSLWHDILETKRKIYKEKSRLSQDELSDDERGWYIFYFFRQDLLRGLLYDIVSRCSPPRSMFSPSNFTHKGCHHEVSPKLKMCGIFVMVAMNLIFCWYILLYFLDPDKPESAGWRFSFVMWLVLEIAITCTYTVLLSRIVFPMAAYSKMKQFTSKMSTILLETNGPSNNKENSELRVFGSHVSTMNQDQPLRPRSSPFSLCTSLFVSTNIASNFPHLIESKIVKSYRCIVPNQPYWSSSDNILMSSLYRFRVAPFLNSIAAFLVYLFRQFLLLCPQFEYYLISLFGWTFLRYANEQEIFDSVPLYAMFLLFFFIYMGIICAILALVSSIKQLVHKKVKETSKVAPDPMLGASGSQRSDTNDEIVEEDKEWNMKESNELSQPEVNLCADSLHRPEYTTPTVPRRRYPTNLMAAYSFISDESDVEKVTSTDGPGLGLSLMNRGLQGFDIEPIVSSDDSEIDDVLAFNRLRARNMIPNPEDVPSDDEDTIAKGLAMVHAEKVAIRKDRSERKLRRQDSAVKSVEGPHKVVSEVSSDDSEIDDVLAFNRLRARNMIPNPEDVPSDDEDTIAKGLAMVHAEKVSIRKDRSERKLRRQDSAVKSVEGPHKVVSEVSSDDSEIDDVLAFNRLRARNMIPNPEDVPSDDEDTIAKGLAMVHAEKVAIRKDRSERKLRRQDSAVKSVEGPHKVVSEVSSDDSEIDDVLAFNRLRARNMIPNPEDVPSDDEDTIAKGLAMVHAEKVAIRKDRSERKLRREDSIS